MLAIWRTRSHWREMTGYTIGHGLPRRSRPTFLDRGDVQMVLVIIVCALIALFSD